MMDGIFPAVFGGDRIREMAYFTAALAGPYRCDRKMFEMVDEKEKTQQG